MASDLLRVVLNILIQSTRDHLVAGGGGRVESPESWHNDAFPMILKLKPELKGGFE